MKSYELPIANPMPLEKFTTVKIPGQKVFELVGEISDFDGQHFQRLYNDAIDLGIGIRSNFTGKVERFFMTREDHEEGSPTAWHFAPLDGSCRVSHVVIFND